MSALVFKGNVLLAGLRPEMVVGLHVVSQVYADIASDCVVIGGCSENGGSALDLRAHHLTEGKRRELVSMAKARLPYGFDIALDSATLNARLSYDPERHL